MNQGNNTSCGVEVAYHSVSTGRPPECLCDFVVHLTTHFDLLPPVRLSGDILPKPHIDTWLTANNIMITCASVDKNCLNRLLFASCSYTTATTVGFVL